VRAFVVSTCRIWSMVMGLLLLPPPPISAPRRPEAPTCDDKQRRE
jgi:hypothetical protein